MPVGVVLEGTEAPWPAAVARAMPADHRLEHTLDRIRRGVAGGHAQRRVGEGPITGQARQDHRGGECRHEHVGPPQRLEQIGGVVGGGALVVRRDVAHPRVQGHGGDEQGAAREPAARG
jgi:hypothetical protein